MLFELRGDIFRQADPQGATNLACFDAHEIGVVKEGRNERWLRVVVTALS